MNAITRELRIQYKSQLKQEQQSRLKIRGPSTY